MAGDLGVMVKVVVNGPICIGYMPIGRNICRDGMGIVR